MTGGPDLESLRVLVLVGVAGSLSRVAAELGISQPAVSKRLSTLERGMGLVLVDRSRRGSVLSPSGLVVAGWAQRVLDEMDGLMTGVDALRVKRDAQLRVAASTVVAEYLAPLWIGELRASEPTLYVGLQVTNSDKVTALTRTGEVDLGFIESPEAPAGLSTRCVATDRLVVVVAPGHPWTRRRTPLRPHELAAAPMVAREPGSGTRATVDRALAAAGVRRVPPLVELGSATAVRSAVIAGTGPAVISELAVGNDVAAGRLVEIVIDGMNLHRTLRAIWPGNRRLIGPAAALLAVARRRP